MRLIAVTAAVVAAMFLPAAAEAHHVDLNASSAVCALENNVPTLTVTVVYVAFEDVYKDGSAPGHAVQRQLTINGTVAVSGPLTWAGPNYTDVIKRTVAGGVPLDVVYETSWGRGNFVRFRPDIVMCPLPVPPPVVIDCKGNPVPPGVTPATCLPPVTVPPPVTTPPVVTPPATPPCVLTRTHRVRVRAKERSSITVNLTNTPTGSPVTLKLPRQKAITGATDETGTVVFKFRAKHRGIAVVTTNCGSVRAKVRPPHKTTSRQPPRTVG